MSVFHWRSIRLLGAAVLPILLMGFIWSGQTPRALAAGSSTITLSVSQTTQSLGVPVTLTATVLDGNAQPISGVAVTFVLVSGPDAGESGGATTGGNGQAISNFTGTHGPGVDTIGAQFTDSGGSLIQSNTVQVNWVDNTITLSVSATTQSLGAPVTFTATITRLDGQPIPNQQVSFILVSGPDAGERGGATTDNNGQATSNFTGTHGPGIDTIGAQFFDNGNTLVHSNTVQVNWVDNTITLSVSPTTQSLGTPVTFTATITGLDGQPIPNVQVTFILLSGPDAGESGGATTDSSGQAISSFLGSNGPGIDTIGSQFTDSGGNLVHSNTVQVLWGTDPSSITLNPSTTTQNVGTSATVTATVTGPDGNPAVNQTVNFTVVSGPDAGSQGAATTDANGHAAFTFTDSSAAGTDIVQASFTDSFGQAATSNQVQVTWKDASSVALSGPTSTQKLGTLVTVTATINGPDGQPAANQTVTFTVVSGPDAGSHGTAVTDTSGNASFTFTDTTTPGTDVVQASFTDSIGVNRTSDGFQVVFVGDTTPPTLILPSSITVDATGPSGAVVTYTVTATDPDNPPSQLTIKCLPISGGAFAIGTTTVNCTASDPSGNSASGSFQVVVKGAAAQVNDLLGLVDSFHLSPKGIQTSFDSQLQAVLADLQANNIVQARSDLTSFINHVNAQSGQHLTVSQANQLLAATRQVQAILGC